MTKATAKRLEAVEVGATVVGPLGSRAFLLTAGTAVVTARVVASRVVVTGVVICGLGVARVVGLVVACLAGPGGRLSPTEVPLASPEVRVAKSKHVSE